MNETTLFISQMAGPLFLIMGLAFLIQKNFYGKLFEGLAQERSFLFLDGVGETLIGLSIVLSHNLWTTAPEIVVSLLGWLTLIEGILVLLMGKAYVRGMLKVFAKSAESMLVLSGLVFLLLGAYLGWVGYLM